MNLEQSFSYGTILSTELAKISDSKTLFGIKTYIFHLVNYFSLLSYGVSIQSPKNAAFSYFQSLTEVLTRPPAMLQIPLNVLFLLLNLFIYGAIQLLAIQSYRLQNKVNVSNKQQEKLRQFLSQIIEIMVCLSCPILSINCSLIKNDIQGWRSVPILNIIAYTIMCLSHMYFYRNYKFNQQGFYRPFDMMQVLYFGALLAITLSYELLENNIYPYILLIMSVVQLLESIVKLPYKISKENQYYIMGITANILYSLLGILNLFNGIVDQNNIFETFLLFYPIFYTLSMQLLLYYWQILIKFMKSNNNTKSINIRKLCSSLEALIWYVETARSSGDQLLTTILILRFHIEHCNDVNCECKVQKESIQQSQADLSMTHRSSFHSKTALLSNQGDQKSANNNVSQVLEMSQFNKTLKDLSQPKQGQDTFMQEIVRKVNSIQQPMKFVLSDRIDEELIAKYIKRQFHQTIQLLSFTLNLDQVEYLSLKYISFMFSFKQNSPSSLVKLRQIQSRSDNFSYFFRNICKVTETFLIDSVQFQHKAKIEIEENFQMNVTEIWRLEIVKDTIVKSIVQVLRKKIRVWEELCSGEINNMDRFLTSLIEVSKQIETSRGIVDQVLGDFPTSVQRNYSYYLKYQCFRALFFDSDYKQAVIFQRKVEDAWSVSKSGQRQGQLGNYQWLCGDLLTLEVSIAVSNGAIIKGISQRLVDLLGYQSHEEMMGHLKIRSASHASSHKSQGVTISSLMPPFLMASHHYYVNRFIQRGHTDYYGKPITSFIQDARGFTFPVNIHLSFNFENLSDFTLLGSILRVKDDNDYLIFDEWGRILGVSLRMFDKLITKGSLDEFGMIEFQVENKIKKHDKMGNLKSQMINKIANDDNAKLFKRTLTMNQKASVNTTRTAPRRTYSKPSDILLQFGSIQHFLPQIAKQMSELMAKDIFKKLQKESQTQFNKLTEKAQNQDQMLYEKQTSNIFQRQISAMIDRQSSMNGGGGLTSAMLDKNQYRNFVKNNFIDENGLMKKTSQILQDEKLTLFVPRNYNELIEYFNDAGDRYMESKGDFETRSIKRQQIQNKHSYVKQQQNCYHVFDAEFQDFIDNKVRKYYSKSLLKEALESQEAKFLNMVRYKTLCTVDVGVGGVSDDDQFLYFVCKLSNLNLMTAKRRDVLKLHMKKDKKQQFDAGDELRKSLIQLQSIDSDNNTGNRPRYLSNLDSFGSIKDKSPQQKSNTQPPIVVSLAIPAQRNYNSNNTDRDNKDSRDEGPNLKVEMVATTQKLNESSFEIENSMKDSLLSNSMRQSLNIPSFSRQNSFEKLKELSITPVAVPVKKDRQSFNDIIKQQSSSQSNPKFDGFQKQQSSSQSEPKIDIDNKLQEPPKKPLKLSFLKKMEKALQSKTDVLSNTNVLAESPQFKAPSLSVVSGTQDKRTSSLLSPMNAGSSNNIFTKLFQRLNLRRVSNVEIKNDVFEQNHDQGFKEQSENSETNKDNQSDSFSQDNSMSSNNMSLDALANEDEDLKNLEDDELVNIFEVMSQASNHQSVKSISAISMATNISLRCLNYMPRQAKSLQFFKLFLISLNIAGIISLLTTTESYFLSLQPDPLSNSISDRYRHLCMSAQSSNQLDQQQIIDFQYLINSSLFLSQTEHAYNASQTISQAYYNTISKLSSIRYPLNNPTLLNVSTQYQCNSISDFLTNDKIELDSIQIVYNYHSTSNNNTITAKLYNTTMNYLFNRVFFNQAHTQDITEQLIQLNHDQMENKSLLIIILMASFGGLHCLVICFIIPYIKQINDIYWRVLQIVSRVTQDEAVDEIKKLTLSQHLLETNDDGWVTSNQIKLVFYNKSHDLDLNYKYSKTTKSKGKESSYFQTKLSDTTLSIWRDMILYISISAISIGYLLFAIITIQSQINQFQPYIQNYDYTVATSVYVSNILTKLSLTPQRYLEINSENQIPSQYMLYQFQMNSQISYLLSSISVDSQQIRDFMNNISNFQEEINLQYNFKSTTEKIQAKIDNFNTRLSEIEQMSILTEINHILKDNLCYYSQVDICQTQQQVDYYNTGLIGALDLVAKFQFNSDTFLKDYHTITYSNIQNETMKATVNAYYNSLDYQLLISYGQQVLAQTFERLTTLMKEFLIIEKNNKYTLIKNLFIGIGIPIMMFTILLAILEMIQLKRKVKRVMLSLTYLPTFKFQEKIMLSLIKAVLKL